MRLYFSVVLLRDTHHCFTIRDVPQRQQISTSTAVLMEQEWPLHPFPLQLPLAAVVDAIN